jgi:hypothetical protein
MSKRFVNPWLLVPEYARQLRAEGNEPAAAEVERLAVDVASDQHHAVVIAALEAVARDSKEH